MSGAGQRHGWCSSLSMFYTSHLSGDWGGYQAIVRRMNSRTRGAGVDVIHAGYPFRPPFWAYVGSLITPSRRLTMMVYTTHCSTQQQCASSSSRSYSPSHVQPSPGVQQDTK